jgi:mycothiol synthase
MDQEKYLVRPFADGDYEPVARIGSKVNPELHFSAQEKRHWEAQFLGSHLVNERWVVEERATGKVVASASMSHSPFSYDAHKFWAGVSVDPDYRGRGIGLALSALIESEAACHRAVCLWTSVRKDDPRSLAFSHRHGFRELRKLWISALDLTRLPPPETSARGAALEREGIRFTRLSEEGPARLEVRQKLFDLLNETSRDVPRLGEYSPISFEQFVGEFDSPGFLPEAWFIASDKETFVAISNLEKSLTEVDSLRVGFTGTRAAYRGRGIATELKRRALEYAREKGVRFLRTVNDSLNLPMWAINQKQGFVRTFEWSAQERRFPGADRPPESKALP